MGKETTKYQCFVLCLNKNMARVAPNAPSKTDKNKFFSGILFAFKPLEIFIALFLSVAIKKKEKRLRERNSKIRKEESDIAIYYKEGALPTLL